MNNQPILSVSKVSKSFGGVLANRNVDLEMHRNEIHAILGPNGAGKSTFINLVAGNLRPTGGTILYKGEDITQWGRAKRAKAGIGRTYQTVNLFENLSVWENCRLAVQASDTRVANIFTNPAKYKPYIQGVQAALDRVEWPTGTDRKASELSHGERRQLEIAVAICASHEVLLLDEPLAGTGEEEAKSIMKLITHLKRTCAILLVEHDVNAVLSVSDTLTVMTEGGVLVSGDPNSVCRDERVQEAYLGSDEGG